MKFTWLTRERSKYLTDRYSERVESAEAVSRRVNKAVIKGYRAQSALNQEF